MLEDLSPEGTQSPSWLDDASAEQDEVEVEEFDIVSSPNDWNFTTIVNFLESGAIKIPSFQRNYVWDQRRASKLIESLLLGLPVPQVFLYEQSRNDFIVIDGQQRLLTLYFFYKGRFPQPKNRAQLRPALSEGRLDDSVLDSEENFQQFKLSLPKRPGQAKSRYHGKTYRGLGEDRIGLDLRTLRNVVVKQTHPEGSSAVFEIFNRLNTGGINLTPQEIRASLYNSELMRNVIAFNLDSTWRRVVGTAQPDARMRDSEFLLRSLAIARGLDSLSGSLTNFINSFCEQARNFTAEQAADAISDLQSFVAALEDAPAGTFERTRGKFSGVLFESAFAGYIRAGKPSLRAGRLVETVDSVKAGEEFSETLQEGSTKPMNIRKRVHLFQDSFAAED